MPLSSRPCDECEQHIVFLKTDTGSTMPVDAESLDPDDDEDTMFDKDRHVTHFSTCTKPDRFRKKDQPVWKFAKLALADGRIIHVAVSGDRCRVKFDKADPKTTVEMKMGFVLAQTSPVALEVAEG